MNEQKPLNRCRLVPAGATGMFARGIWLGPVSMAWLCVALLVAALAAGVRARAPNPAPPTLQEVPAALPVVGLSELSYTFIDRGSLAVSSLPELLPKTLPAGAASAPVRAVRILDAIAWRAFWRGGHPRRRCGPDEAAGPAPPPPIDFHRCIIIICLGQPGSAEVSLVGLAHQPHRVLATVANVDWSDFALPRDRAPYAAVLCYRSDLPFAWREDPVTRAFNRLCAGAPSCQRYPDGRRRDLTFTGLLRLRDVEHREAESFLARLWRLQTAHPQGPYLPYSKLLEARIQEEVAGRAEPARAHYEQIVQRFPGSPCARLARHRLERLTRRDMDETVRHVLDGYRDALAGSRTVAAGDGRRWEELGQEYEYLLTCRPEGLFMAARCYLDGARDHSSQDTERNCLLRAAEVYGTYLNRHLALSTYWECVRRFPDAPSVAIILRRMNVLYQQLEPGRANQAYHRFLHAFPNAATAREVRRLLAGDSRQWSKE